MALGIMLYAWQSWEYGKQGDWPMAGVFIGYCLANAFFIADFIRRIDG